MRCFCFLILINKLAFSVAYPPLHYGMSVPQWTAALSEAYDGLIQRLNHHQVIAINPYAATSPEENWGAPRKTNELI